jgi:hypothetical protein
VAGIVHIGVRYGLDQLGSSSSQWYVVVLFILGVFTLPLQHCCSTRERVQLTLHWVYRSFGVGMTLYGAAQ